MRIKETNYQIISILLRIPAHTIKNKLNLHSLIILYELNKKYYKKMLRNNFVISC